MRTVSLLAATFVSFTTSAMGLEDGIYLYGEDQTPPASVMALQDCTANARTPASRRPFAGGYIFAIKCASNNENYVETLIFSEHDDGKDAWLLLFPGPGDRRDGFEDLLPNIRWYPDKNEIGMIAVDSDPNSRPTPNVTKRDPRIVCWRETPDCDGKTGWKICQDSRRGLRHGNVKPTANSTCLGSATE